MIRYLNEGCSYGCGCHQGCCSVLPTVTVPTVNFIATSNPACQAVDSLAPLDLGAAVAQGGSVSYTPGNSTVLLSGAGTYYLSAVANTCDETQTTVGLALALNGIQLSSGTVEFQKEEESNTALTVGTIVTVAAPASVTLINPTDSIVNYENLSLNVFKLA